MYTFYTNNWDMPKRPIHKFFFLMRLTTVLLIASMLQVSASGYGQRLNYVRKHVTLLELFKEIRVQTGYNVVWPEQDVNTNASITANFRNIPIVEVLDQSLKGLNLSYVINNKTIIVKATTPSILDKTKSVIQRIFQDINVRGYVVDDQNSSLRGATVKIKGSNRLTTTNEQGAFSLANVPEQSILVISYLGYQTQEVKASADMGAVKLRLNTDKLEEVEINAGYYTVKNKERTGSISRVTAETIGKQPVSNVLSALIGRMPGVNIVQRSGLPGSSFSIQIRGRNSLRTYPNNPVDGNLPLYIIDGVSFPSSPLQQIGGEAQYQSSPLNAINPNDIESIEILKDADATAIYGSKGANGVVLITTKRGNSGAVKVDFNVYTGISKLPKQLALLNTQQYVGMRKEAFKNDGVTPTLANAPDLILWDTTRYTNWQEKLLGGTGHNENAQVSLAGGSSQIRFLVSGNYNVESSILPGDFDFKRGSIRSNIQYNSNSNKFRAAVTTTYSMSDNKLPSGGLTSQALSLPPNAPDPYNADGSLNWANGTWNNPYAYLFRSYSAKTNSFISNIALSYTIFPGLTAKTNISYSSLLYDENEKRPIRSLKPGSTNGLHVAQFAKNEEYGYAIEPQLDYTFKVFGGTLSALTGLSIQQNVREGQFLNASGFSTEALIDNLGSATTITGNTSYTQYRYAAVFGRLNYNYRSKYIVNLTGRRDGSSRFGPGKQWGNFGAIGTAWIFSEEAFIQQALPFVSVGKLRASYGITGSDQIGDYGYLDSYKAAGLYLQAGLSPARLANPVFSWESNIKKEIAIEAGFLNSKLLLSISYYHNRSGNQLVGYPLPDMVGFSSVQANLPATVENKGWEFELDASLIQNSNFSWKTNINFTSSKNKLASFPNIALSSYNGLIVGQPLNLQRGSQFVGVDAGTGLYSFLDVNNNKTIGVEDAKLLPISQPLFGGIDNNFVYKNFELSVFWQVVFKSGLDYRSFFQTPGLQHNQPVEVLNRWTPQNTESSIQKYTQKSTITYSLWQLSDGNFNNNLSFARLKNIALSWNVPKTFQEKLKLQAFRIYLQGQNLFTMTKYKGFDPENVSTGTPPPLRTLTAGIQLTL